MTQRDDYLIKKALAYAIEAIDRLPKQWQEASDRDDMVKLLEQYSRVTADCFLTDFWIGCDDMAELLDGFSRDTVEYFRVRARSHLARRDVAINQDNGQLDLAPLQGAVVPFPK